MPAATGSTAMASSPATRAMALLTPDAVPAYVSGTAERTAEVSGATVIASPTPNTTTPGRTAFREVVPGTTRAINANPTAAISGPAVMGNRGPVRCPSAPAHGAPIIMMIVIGSSARPAASAV